MTDSIQFTDAAKFYAEEPHQVAAWEYLQEEVRPKVISEFARIYRTVPEPEPGTPGGGSNQPAVGAVRLPAG